MKRTLYAVLFAAASVFILGSGLIWAQAEPSNQLWANVTLGFHNRHKLYFELDIEPKVQVSASDAFRNVDITPAIEFYPNAWVDLTGEALIGHTHEYSDIDSFEYTGRIGIRIHILSSNRKMLFPEEKLLGRIVLANLTRLEYRNFAYTGDTPNSHGWRLRDRLEFKYPLNTANMGVPKTYFILADVEAYFTLGQSISQTFASKVRLRAGIGYRASNQWRVEILYIRDWARNTLDQYDISMNALDLRFGWTF